MSEVKPGNENLENGSLPNPDFVVKHSGEPVVHELRTPLDKAPVHPVPETIEEFMTLEPTYKKKWPKRVIQMAAGVALGMGAYIAGGSGDDGEPTAISTPTTDLLVPSTTEQELVTNPGESGEVASDEGPVLITANTYEGLTSQLRHNLLCMFNSSYQNIQEKCLTYIVGDEPGNLTSLMRQRLADVNDYRISNPDYKVEISFSDPTPGGTQDNLKIDGNTAVLVTSLTDDVSSELKRY
jgi:hypothetical protein